MSQTGLGRHDSRLIFFLPAAGGFLCIFLIIFSSITPAVSLGAMAVAFQH